MLENAVKVWPGQLGEDLVLAALPSLDILQFDQALAEAAGLSLGAQFGHEKRNGSGNVLPHRSGGHTNMDPAHHILQWGDSTGGHHIWSHGAALDLMEQKGKT